LNAYELGNFLRPAVRPQTEKRIRQHYLERSGGVAPSELRAKEILELCMSAMRMSVEKSFDERDTTDNARKKALNAIYLMLRQ
jgi:hypothetical protein